LEGLPLERLPRKHQTSVVQSSAFNSNLNDFALNDININSADDTIDWDRVVNSCVENGIPDSLDDWIQNGLTLSSERRNRRHSDNVQGDLFAYNETIFDVDASQLMPVFEGAYKYTKPTKWSSDDESKFIEALRICGTDLELVTALMDGWTYEKVRKKFKIELKKDPKLISTILAQRREFRTQSFNGIF